MAPTTNKLLPIAGVVLLVGGIIALAIISAPKNRSSRSCHDTQTAYVATQNSKTPEEYRRYRHLGNDFVACRGPSIYTS